ncbi:neutral zinc metallopeptidase [Phytophthora sojae]|uniref:Neutral zinc metallopeptidase n=1 Tax=Phytophthora sojae (strain P6497) TaxID=1094619 RepID=G4ZQ81_PHYSP|nr:neutral zinc metallopeptidase [Phytophthora sojae]EGZ14792.1 neutral zinc metallopeptidase [Phytophthora sojae]|eukprot:XP_009528541.1 neutral zinc metallopeptidase [Phytophthora sojae]
MAPTRLPHLIAAALAATSTAAKVAGHHGHTHAPATVAPAIETQASSSDSPNQWTQTSNDVPTVAPTAPSSASGSQGWSQPTTTSPASSETGGNANQGSSQVTQTSSPSSSSSDTASSSNTAQSATQGSNATQTQTSINSTSSGDHATFGTVTSKAGECVVGNPNKYVSAADVDWIWANHIGPNAPTRDANWNFMDNKNWIMDHIVKNKGTLNYCMLERQYAAWNHWLIGYDCWPYNEIKINVVGWAVKDASLLDWTDDSMGTITVGDLDSDKCYRFYDNGAGSWSDTSGCKGEPFDISLWPKQGLEGGFGCDWGQEVNLENMLSTLDQDELVIVAHEIGHGFGLPDFYEDADKPNAQWPNCIMMAGSSMTLFKIC